MKQGVKHLPSQKLGEGKAVPLHARGAQRVPGS